MVAKNDVVLVAIGGTVGIYIVCEVDEERGMVGLRLIEGGLQHWIEIERCRKVNLWVV